MSAQQLTLDGETAELPDDRFKKSLSGIALVLWEVGQDDVDDELGEAHRRCVKRGLIDGGNR